MKNILTKKCIVCGKEIKRQYNGRKFCSRNCYYRWQKENPNKGCFQKGNTKGFQKNHSFYKGGEKGWFKKGQMPWNKGTHIQSNNALEVWMKNGGTVKGSHGKTNDALNEWRKKNQPIKGKRHWNWKGGISKIRERIEAMPEYKEWRMSVFVRDNFTCQECGKKGRLHPHHLKEISLIIRENKIKNVDDARKCKELWEISNGKTLCIPCHKRTRSYLKSSN